MNFRVNRKPCPPSSGPSALQLTFEYDTPRPITNRYSARWLARHRLFEAGRETADRRLHARVPEMGLEHNRQEHVLVGVRRTRIARHSGSDGPAEMRRVQRHSPEGNDAGSLRRGTPVSPTSARRPRCTSPIRRNAPSTWTRLGGSSISRTSCTLPMSECSRTSSSPARTNK